ncbi:hypothetical protein LSH36_1129g00042 [Paralvinella palmiformis]|uniref:Protein Wnt n=1 Tax=Paralvinella palmiformis TaxID=53620 RepID=A0AAD9MQ40_9ANNE|nr:hypothetical protein LSH36_1129g00042 [Paralvinella palmiformis]
MDPNRICKKSRRVGGKQHRICLKEPEIVREIANGAKMAVGECRYQFKDRRWNCPTKHRGIAKVLRLGHVSIIDTSPSGIQDQRHGHRNNIRKTTVPFLWILDGGRPIMRDIKREISRAFRPGSAQTVSETWASPYKWLQL